jgi:hypothetical protein
MYDILTPDRVNSTAAQHNYSFTLCLALSEDGFSWHKPDLHLFEEDGSTANNIILRGQDLYGASVVHDPETADAQQRFKVRRILVNTKTHL